MIGAILGFVSLVSFSFFTEFCDSKDCVVPTRVRKADQTSVTKNLLPFFSCYCWVTAWNCFKCKDEREFTSSNSLTFEELEFAVRLSQQGFSFILQHTCFPPGLSWLFCLLGHEIFHCFVLVVQLSIENLFQIQAQGGARSKTIQIQFAFPPTYPDVRRLNLTQLTKVESVLGYFLFNSPGFKSWGEDSAVACIQICGSNTDVWQGFLGLLHGFVTSHGLQYSQKALYGKELVLLLAECLKLGRNRIIECHLQESGHLIQSYSKQGHP